MQSSSESPGPTQRAQRIEVGGRSPLALGAVAGASRCARVRCAGGRACTGDTVQQSDGEEWGGGSRAAME